MKICYDATLIFLSTEHFYVARNLGKLHVARALGANLGGIFSMSFLSHANSFLQKGDNNMKTQLVKYDDKNGAET